MKKSNNKILAKRKRKITKRLKGKQWENQAKPMFRGSNIHYEIDGRHKGISNGGIGTIHLMSKKLGFVEEIDTVLHLLKRHLPYHESDHVLNIVTRFGIVNTKITIGGSTIVMNHFTDNQILTQTDALLEENPKEKILVFACNWCSYAGADYAGVSRLQYPPNVCLIRTMCSGRVDEKFIWHGFQKGAPLILVSGCHIGDCHYIDANQWTEKRNELPRSRAARYQKEFGFNPDAEHRGILLIKKVHKKMAKLGIRPERLQLEGISAAEGVLFAKLMQRMETLRQGVTTDEIAETIEILKSQKK